MSLVEVEGVSSVGEVPVAKALLAEAAAAGLPAGVQGWATWPCVVIVNVPGLLITWVSWGTLFLPVGGLCGNYSALAESGRNPQPLPQEWNWL